MGIGDECCYTCLTHRTLINVEMIRMRFVRRREEPAKPQVTVTFKSGEGTVHNPSTYL